MNDGDFILEKEQPIHLFTSIHPYEEDQGIE